MIALTDCDIIIKSAAADLLHFLPKALNVSRREIYVAPSTKFSVGSKARRKAWGNDVINKAVGFAAAQPIITQSATIEQDLFVNTDAIDEGEIVLFAATRFFSDARIITGDKKALWALYLSVEGRAVYERNIGRVLCFEQVLLRLMNVMGFDALKSRVIDSPLMKDGAVSACFINGADTTEAEARGRLEKYVADLRSETGGLLHE